MGVFLNNSYSTSGLGDKTGSIWTVDDDGYKLLLDCIELISSFDGKGRGSFSETETGTGTDLSIKL
jgi:hypothetical protein